MTPPTVVNIRDAAYDVYIGRAVPRRGLKASVYANPYRMACLTQEELPREKAIAMYEALWRKRLRGKSYRLWRERLRRLDGKVLGCWCSPKPCHGDVLVKLFVEFVGVDTSCLR